MPLRGKGHLPLVGDDAPYFQSLAALDDWASTPAQKLAGVLPYKPRSAVIGTSEHRGKLLASIDSFLVA
jgi:mannosyl-glycoprotein endo-beta-N-acetylglucosaminidase